MAVSAGNPCGVCPPGRDGQNGRDGHPGRDGMPGRDGTPGICLGQSEQDKQIAQLRWEVSEKIAIAWCGIDNVSMLFVKLDELKQKTGRQSLLSGARVCATGSYLAFGYCLPKSPSPYVNHTSCSSGFTLYNGVCYRWPTSPQCQTQDLPTSHKICTVLGGRLCTVPELDRLVGTGCNANFGGSWASIGLQYGNVYQGYGICFRDDNSYTDAHSTTLPVTNSIETIAWCNAVSSLATLAHSNVKAFVICCKT